MKHIFIVNPAAGKDLAEKRYLPLILGASKKMGVEYEIHKTFGAGDAERFTRRRCESRDSAGNREEEVFRFYACGGDGTLNEVVNGAFGHPNTEIAMLPAGTGNDFPRNFRDVNGFQCLERQINGRAIQVDLIRYQTLHKSGEKTDPVKYCINMFNMGLDCNVADQAMKLKKYPLVPRSFAYGVGIGIQLYKKAGIDLDIEFDDGTTHTGTVLLTAVANGSFCGGGYKGLPYADICDGKIDVSIIENVTRRIFMTFLGKYRKGTHLADPRTEQIVTYKQCKSLTIAPKHQITLCIDGEITLTEGVRFEIVPKAINFSVPQGCEL